MSDEPASEESAAPEDSGKYKGLDAFDGVEIGGLPAIAPDGGFAPGPIGMSPAVPAATPELFICLRGPCVHYWEMSTFFESGNPAETWGEDGLKDEHGERLRMPQQIHRSCLAHPGTETELTDGLVYECNRWLPFTSSELKQRHKRRERYYKIRPNHRPRR